MNLDDLIDKLRKGEVPDIGRSLAIRLGDQIMELSERDRAAEPLGDELVDCVVTNGFVGREEAKDLSPKGAAEIVMAKADLWGTLRHDTAGMGLPPNDTGIVAVMVDRLGDASALRDILVAFGALGENDTATRPLDLLEILLPPREA